MYLCSVSYFQIRKNNYQNILSYSVLFWWNYLELNALSYKRIVNCMSANQIVNDTAEPSWLPDELSVLYRCKHHKKKGRRGFWNSFTTEYIWIKWKKFPTPIRVDQNQFEILLCFLPPSIKTECSVYAPQSSTYLVSYIACVRCSLIMYMCCLA